jgi:hypothetical protein
VYVPYAEPLDGDSNFSRIAGLTDDACYRANAIEQSRVRLPIQIVNTRYMRARDDHHMLGGDWVEHEKRDELVIAPDHLGRSPAGDDLAENTGSE